VEAELIIKALQRFERITKPFGESGTMRARKDR
jgi:hypothetical protein